MALLLKTAIAAAFLASAIGAEIETAAGNVNVRVARAKEFRATRDMEQTASLFAVKEDVDTLKDDFKGAQSAMEFNKLLAPYVGNSINRIDDLNKDMAATKSKVDGISSAVDKKVAALAKQLGDDAKKRADDMEKKMALLTAANEKLKKDLEAAQSKVSTDLGKKVDDLSTKVNADVKKSIDEVKKGMADVPIHMWSGYPRSHNRGSGWANLNLDYTEFDSLAPYAKKISATHFQIQKNGLYKFEVNMMMHTSSRGHSGYQINVGGYWVNDRTHTYAYSWKQHTHTVWWPCKAGQTVYSRVYVSNSGDPYKWHQTKHSRFQMTYVGQYGSKCSGGRCTI